MNKFTYYQLEIMEDSHHPLDGKCFTSLDNAKKVALEWITQHGTARLKTTRRINNNTTEYIEPKANTVKFDSESWNVSISAEAEGTQKVIVSTIKEVMIDGEKYTKEEKNTVTTMEKYPILETKNWTDVPKILKYTIYINKKEIFLEDTDW